MGNFLGFLKGGIDVGKTTDNLLSKLDDSKFTEQEKAMHSKSIMDGSIEFFKLSLGESTIRSKTRRNLAHLLVGNTVIIFWLCVYLIFKEVDITKILELATVFKMGWAFISVIGFYFGTHLLRSHQSKNKMK